MQGSRARPYRIRIGITAYGKAQWAQLERVLADDAFYAAHLLAGEMPEEIEGLFASLNLPLFPSDANELSMDCTCPDWQVPCKHIAAAFYLLAEAFDDDPFTILSWRGRDRDTLLSNLAAARAGAERGLTERHTAATPLEELVDTYFDMPMSLPDAREVAPASGESVLDKAPAITLALNGTPLRELLRPAYLAFGADQGAGPRTVPLS